MAGSRFEYVRKFEIENPLLLNTYIVVRIDGKGFTKFTTLYEYQKPNDIRGLQLMTKCAENVMKMFQDIWIAYGQSDEYSFILRKNTELFNRRSEKIVSCIVSCFSSSFALYFNEFFKDQKLMDVPVFDGRCICYPSDKNLRDYLSWRQADCHINNLYNTCFWSLVQIDKLTTEEAHKKLKGTFSSDKNELLFSKYGINYNNIEAIYRKGTIILRVEKKKDEKKVKKEVNKNLKKDEKKTDNLEITLGMMANLTLDNQEINKEAKQKESINDDNLNILDKIAKKDDNIITIKDKNTENEIGINSNKCFVTLYEDLIQDIFWEKYQEYVLL